MLFRRVMNGDGLPATITTSSGSVSVNTTYDLRGIAKLFYVKATTTTTTFDFKLTDRNSRDVRVYPDEGGSAASGTLRDTTPLVVDGKYTFTISGSSKATETFDIMVMVEEKGD